MKKSAQLFRRAIASTLIMVMVGCTAAPEPGGEVNHDPLEGMNRGIYSFNEFIDTILLKPVAQGYRYIVPEYGRERVSNVLTNLKMPINMANSFLQGDPQNGFASFWSFVLNSTFGVAGIFDFTGAATDLRVRKEDFGQTLGVWGVGSGAYLVLPILGPSSTRDAFGLVTDTVADPFNWLDSEIVITRTALTAIDAREKTLDLVEDVNNTSLDPYATFRSGYTQKREAEVNNEGSAAQ